MTRELRIRKLARWAKGVYGVQRGGGLGGRDRKENKNERRYLYLPYTEAHTRAHNLRSPEPKFSFVILLWDILKVWQFGSKSWGEVPKLWSWTKWVLTPISFPCVCMTSCELLPLSEP